MTPVRFDPKRIPNAHLPTRFGEFHIYGFENEDDGEQAVALVCGDLSLPDRVPLVRIHSQCLTGDTLHSLRCDCGDQLETALRKMERYGAGVLIYQMQEGRGIGLINKLFAYVLQDQGIDTVDANLQLGFEADSRTYDLCAAILNHLGVARIRLMSNNPEKIRGLERAGIEVVERVPLQIQASTSSEKYLRTKKEKMGHLID
ncbi:MAG TPA: GTP cyclohydrolase II [Acidobacteriota bacterium]|nr:GTP cyclohydrolase II [Acidobacteriota bacterium]